MTMIVMGDEENDIDLVEKEGDEMKNYDLYGKDGDERQ